MKAKDYRQAYCCLAHFYGVISDADAFSILKVYYPDINQAAFRKDLKERSKKTTRGYFIVPMAGSRHYLIAHDFLSDEEFGEILQAGAGREYRILPKKEFLTYKDNLYPEPAPIYQKLADFILERALGQNGSKLSKDMILDCLSYNMRFQGMEKTIKLFLENNAFGFAIGNPNEIRDFIGMLADAHNQTPLPTLRGYSPNEITARWLAQGNRIPMDQFKAVIGKFLESGLWDGDDLRMAVEENKLLSEKAKEELLKELDEVEFESKKDVAKA